MRAPRVIFGAALVLAALARLGLAAGNPMHPAFVVLDAQGQKVSLSGRPASTAMTCMACHDTAYIRAHDSHGSAGAKVDCLACHLPEGSLPQQRAAYDGEGRLKRAWITLGAPTSQQCAACHTVAEIPGHPVQLPQGYLQGQAPGGPRVAMVSRRQGTLWSGQLMSQSQLDLEGKDHLNRPWDVHAARMLSCSDCHSPLSRAPQDTHAGGPTGYLSHDPRQRGIAASLLQPDHRLRTANCLACHTVDKAHAALPYAQRHLEKVACQACHVPSLHAPLLQEDDRSVLQPDGRTRQVWKAVEGGAGDAVNARYIHASTPLLLPYPNEGLPAQVQAVNLVLERRWIDRRSGEELPLETLQRAWQAGHASGAGSAWQSADGSLSAAGQTALAAELRKLAPGTPELQVQVKVQPIVHGIQGGSAVLRRCSACHGAGSRMSGDLPLEATGYLQGARLVDAKGRAYPAHLAALKASPAGLWVQRSVGDALALPGQGRNTWSTVLGFIFFVLTVAGVIGHAAWRWVSQRRRGPDRLLATRVVYLYPAYERLWHWLMALSTLCLVLTGFEVHFTAGLHLLGFATAVKVHNAMAVLLLVNAFLSLFYHLATAHILQFFPRRETLRQDLRAQLGYYLRGIFEGAPHPSPKSPGKKLNVLQQLTYMGLLNVLLPFQAVTGALMWAAGHWPQWSASLVLLTPLHDLGAWLFLSFTVGHVYLTTTGHSLSSNLKAMVDGFDQVEEEAP